MENVREIVLDTLMTMEKEEGFSHELIRNVLDKYDYLETRDKAFIKRVAEGTVERRIELDYYLNSFSSVPVKKMKPLIRSLLRMSIYQILYMDTVPDSAACNEACKLAGKRGFQNLKGFVNGILRKIAREKEHLELPDPQKDLIKYLSVRYSMPEEILKPWIAQYGEDMTEKILKSLLEIHPVSLRITKAGQDQRKELTEMLKEAGIGMKQSPYCENVLLADGMDGAAGLEPFQKGLLTVQDISSVLAVTAAGIREGDLVIDVCAAPGGKSILASELTGKTGRVICGDVSPAKTARIEENIARTGADNIEVRIWDGRNPDEDLVGKGDVVLLDVPCSGLGVMGKKRDIKYHVNEAALKELSELQLSIVENAWKYVKPGGILLYSTCTIREEENRGMVLRILENLPFTPEPLFRNTVASAEKQAFDTLTNTVKEAILQEKKVNRKPSDNEALESCSAQILPGLMEADGFFFAKLRRGV